MNLIMVLLIGTSIGLILSRFIFKEKPVGSLVGWFYDASKSSGDNYIDFGIKENGKESNIELDFNVDGDITNHFED